MTAGGLKLVLQVSALFDPQLNGSLLRSAGCSTWLIKKTRSADQEGQISRWTLLSLPGRVGLQLSRAFKTFVKRFHVLHVCLDSALEFAKQQRPVSCV